VLAASLWVSSPSTEASNLLYSQAVDGQSAFGPSEAWTPSSINSEAADGVIKNPYVSLVKSKKGTVSALTNCQTIS
jgi:hypothetical protein